MKPFFTLLGSSFCLWLLLACSGSTPQLSPLGPDSYVLAFGDSLTFGTGAPTDKAYPVQLHQQTQLKIINAGIPGELSAKGSKRLAPLLEMYSPDLVLLCHGGNDLLLRRSEAELKRHLTTMVEVIRSHGAEVLLIAVPRPRIPLQNAPVYQEVADELGVPLIDKALVKLMQDPALKSDAIHFNARGYARLAGEVEEALHRFGAL